MSHQLFYFPTRLDCPSHCSFGLLQLNGTQETWAGSIGTEDTAEHKKGSWCSADTTSHFKRLLFLSYCLVQCGTCSWSNRQKQGVALLGCCGVQGEVSVWEARGSTFAQKVLEMPLQAAHQLSSRGATPATFIAFLRAHTGEVHLNDLVKGKMDVGRALGSSHE